VTTVDRQTSNATGDAGSSLDAARIWTQDAMSALIAFASSDFDEGRPVDLFEPLVAMLTGDVFGYRGAAVYRDDAEGWQRLAGAGQISQPHLPNHGGSAHFTVSDNDLRLELAGGGGGWLLLIRRHSNGLEAHERSLLQQTAGLVDNLLDQTTYTHLLTKSERHYRHIYSHANLGIFFSRVGAGVRHANPGLLALLGYATERELREAITPQLNNQFYDPPQDRERVLAKLLSEGQISDFKTRLRRSDGSLVPVSLTANLVQDPDRQSEDLEFFGFVTDLSSTETCDEAFRGQRRAEAANLNKVRFLASISHELRTPLNGVMGMAGLLACSSLDAENQAAVTVIQDAAEQMLKLAERMDTFTRLEMGSLTLTHQPFSPAVMVAEVKQRWQPLVADKGLDLQLALEPGVKDCVHGDAGQCAQILDLLLENAVKFTDRGGHLEIGMATEGDSVRLSVNDTGCGMGEEQLARLVDRDTSSADGDGLGGAGLGLAMVWHLVDLMDGRLWIESQEGRGSRFSVLLPLPAAEIATSMAVLPAKDTGAMRILVVEDNPVNQLVARKLLESLELDVSVAGDGHEAVSMITAKSFDLVFMDLQMPGMDGFETTRALRADGKYTGPVVAMTAHATQYHRDKCRHAGMNGFVTKPLERRRLADFLAEFEAVDTEAMEWLWLEPEGNRPLQS